MLGIIVDKTKPTAESLLVDKDDVKSTLELYRQEARAARLAEQRGSVNKQIADIETEVDQEDQFELDFTAQKLEEVEPIEETFEVPVQKPQPVITEKKVEVKSKDGATKKTKRGCKSGEKVKNKNLEVLRMRIPLHEVFTKLCEEGIIPDKSKYLNGLVKKDLEERGFTFEDLNL